REATLVQHRGERTGGVGEAFDGDVIDAGLAAMLGQRVLGENQRGLFGRAEVGAAVTDQDACARTGEQLAFAVAALRAALFAIVRERGAPAVVARGVHLVAHHR